jgi:heptosyltransferase-3
LQFCPEKAISILTIKILKGTLAVVRKDKALRRSLLRNLCRAFYLKISFSFRRKIFIALTEHLGDVVAAEPVIPYLRKKYPQAYICWYVQQSYTPLLKDHPGLNRVMIVTCLTEWIFLKKFLSAKKVLDLHIDGKLCERHGFLLVNRNKYNINTGNYYSKGNLLFAISRTADIQVDDRQSPKQYLRIDPVPVSNRAYVVLHTSSNEKQRGLTSQCWTGLAQNILNRFENVQIFELGFTRQIQTHHDRYVDCTGKRNLDLIASLLYHSKFFIGIDSGFAHLANAMRKDGTIILGDLNQFKNYMPYSGKYQEEQQKSIFYYDGKLENLRWEDVFPFVEQNLGKLV